MYKKLFFDFIKLFTAASIFIFVFALFFISAAETEYDGYIVKLSEPLPEFGILSCDGNSEVKELLYHDDVYLIKDASTVEQLMEEGLVEYAEPNYILELLGGIPNDTYFEYQWTLNAIEYLSLYNSGYSGSGVTVAVIDTGLDVTHPDFAGMMISEASKNFLGDGSHPDAYYRDQAGHGTFVTSQISSVTDNGLGIVGIADDVELMVLRCVANSNSQKFLSDSAYDANSGTSAIVSEAIRYAVDNGADIINISLGARTKSTFITEAVEYAHSKGVIVVAAVGNDSGTAMFYPANNEHVIGVASVSQTSTGYTRSYFSQYNTSVDVTAPGGDVVGIYPYANGGGIWYTDPEEVYCYDSGTSYSSPVVAALAAIVKQINPSLDADDFLTLLTVTSRDLGTAGYDTSYGYGLADAQALLNSVINTEYAINYNLADSQASSAALPKGYIYTYMLNRDEELVLPVPSRDGYAFAGWYLNSDYTGEPLHVLPKGILGNAEAIVADNIVNGYTVSPVSLYAKWIVSSCLTNNFGEYDIYSGEDFSVSLIMPDNNLESIMLDGSIISVENYSLQNDTVTFDTEFLKTLSCGNYSFVFDFAYGDDATFVLSVIDTAPRYTVTFYPAVGYESAHFTMKDVKYNSTVGTLPSAPILADRVFLGWYLSDGTTRITKNTIVTSNLDVYASWSYIGEGDDPGIDSALSADVSFSYITSGEQFTTVEGYASGKAFEMYDITVSGYIPEAGVKVTLPFENISYAYIISGEFLGKVTVVSSDEGNYISVKENADYVVTAEPLVIYGDVNGDGDITLIDIIRIFKRMADANTELNVAAADCSGDFKISVLDVVEALYIILNK